MIDIGGDVISIPIVKLEECRMLVLKGNVGKSVVLQSLMESYQDVYVIVYDKEMIGTLETLFVSSEHYGLEELCDSIKKDIQSECKSRSMIIVYTNLPEADIECIKNLVTKLEMDHFCRYGIVMCKK